MMENRIKDLYENYFKKSKMYEEATDIEELDKSMNTVWDTIQLFRFEDDSFQNTAEILYDAIADVVNASQMQGFVYAWMFFTQFGMKAGVCQ